MFFNLEASESTASSRSEQKEVLAFITLLLLLCMVIFVCVFVCMDLAAWACFCGFPWLFWDGHGHVSHSTHAFVILTVGRRVLLAAFDNLKLLPVSCDTAYPRLHALSLTTYRP